MDQMKFLSFRN